MFKDFLNKLAATTTAIPADDARLALAALLVRVARSDADYSADEAAQIKQILMARFGLDAAQTTALLSDAEVLETEAPDTVRFTRQIKDAIAYDDRLSVIEAMWTVALTDGSRATEENALLRLVAGLLGILDVDSNMIRKKVSRELAAK